MENYEQKFPRLAYFFVYSFFDGWKDEFDWEDWVGPHYVLSVRSYLGNTRYPDIEETYSELKDFLALNLADEEIEEVVMGFGCRYYPPGGGLTYTEFAKNIETIFEEFLEGRFENWF